MKRGNHTIEDDTPKAPAYIVTFTTLTALLLAFFVVLVSMGTIRDDTLLDEGEGGGWSFLESFKSGFGASKKLDVGSAYYYAVENPEEDDDGRTLDAASERVRRILKKAASFGDVAPSPITAEKVNFALTDIHFTGYEVAISAQAERFLKEFCSSLLLDESPANVRLCVLCLGNRDQPREKELVLAARRAKAVEDFLRANLPETGKWSMYSWGTGAESIWTAGDTTVSTQPQVLIAILRSGG